MAGVGSLLETTKNPFDLLESAYLKERSSLLKLDKEILTATKKSPLYGCVKQTVLVVIIVVDIYTLVHIGLCKVYNYWLS